MFIIEMLENSERYKEEIKIAHNPTTPVNILLYFLLDFYLYTDTST